MKELSKNLQPMTIGDILDRSIQLYRSNFLKFIGIILLVKGPYLILESILIDLIESSAAAGAYGPGTSLFILRLLEPTGGSIRYRGVDLAHLTMAEMRAMRKEIQIIFQDPYSSLNPRMTVGSSACR